MYAKRQRKDHKLNTDFSSERFKVVNRKGAEVTIKSTVSGVEYKRYVSHLKKAEDKAQEQERRSDLDNEAELLRRDEVCSDEGYSGVSAGDEQKASNGGESTVDTGAQVSDKRTRLAPKKFQDYVAY